MFRKILLALTLASPLTVHAVVLGDFAPENNKAFSNYAETVQADEKKIFLLNGDSLLSKDINGPFSATQILSRFERNELAANKFFSGKPIRVRTVASEIGENFAREAYIRAEGKTQFDNINLMVNGNDEQILKLNSGDRIDMICSGRIRYVMHTPIVYGCIPSSEYVKNEFFDEPSKLSPNFDTTSNFQGKLIFVYKKFESSIQEACSSSGPRCINYLKTLSDKKTKEDDRYKILLEKNKDKAKQLSGLNE